MYSERYSKRKRSPSVIRSEIIKRFSPTNSPKNLNPYKVLPLNIESNLNSSIEKEDFKNDMSIKFSKEYETHKLLTKQWELLISFARERELHKTIIYHLEDQLIEHLMNQPDPNPKPQGKIGPPK